MFPRWPLRPEGSVGSGRRFGRGESSFREWGAPEQESSPPPATADAGMNFAQYIPPKLPILSHRASPPLIIFLHARARKKSDHFLRAPPTDQTHHRDRDRSEARLRKDGRIDPGCGADRQPAASERKEVYIPPPMPPPRIPFRTALPSNTHSTSLLVRRHPTATTSTLPSTSIRSFSTTTSHALRKQQSTLNRKLTSRLGQAPTNRNLETMTFARSVTPSIAHSRPHTPLGRQQSNHGYFGQ